jgi:hypothetical protein
MAADNAVDIDEEFGDAFGNGKYNQDFDELLFQQVLANLDPNDLPPPLRDDVDFDFDDCMHGDCPRAPSSQQVPLCRTTLAQVLLRSVLSYLFVFTHFMFVTMTIYHCRYLYGMTRTTMVGLATILRWKDADGNYVFKVEDMVAFDTLPNLLDQLPLLKTYIKTIVTVNEKGKTSSQALATHSLTDVTRRLLQLVPLDLMVFHAKQGHTRYCLFTDFFIHAVDQF